MSRRRNYGKCVYMGRNHLTLGRCYECGTHNPALPGDPKPEKCAGCGQDLPRDERLVKPWRFERKKGRPEAAPRGGGD